jgi:isoquinoline 1-oxidoreductase subunit alpha
MVRVELHLNGAPTAVEAPPGTPLLWVLRDVLNLTGTKYGCGRMLCGACTVHVDGAATRTCLLPFEQVAGKRVTTIEGLAGSAPGGGVRGGVPDGAGDGAGDGAVTVAVDGAAPGARHPLQEAWIAEQVPQCGLCQSGQIMTAAALLARVPVPTDADIDEALSGVLCRCATYVRIRAAIHRAAQYQAAQYQAAQHQAAQHQAAARRARALEEGE